MYGFSNCVDPILVFTHRYIPCKRVRTCAEGDDVGLDAPVAQRHHVDGPEDEGGGGAGVRGVGPDGHEEEEEAEEVEAGEGGDALEPPQVRVGEPAACVMVCVM